MAVPKKHFTRSKVGKKRSQKGLKKQDIQPCPQCKAPALPHRRCTYCHTYAWSKRTSTT
ncbi:MAG TPA: 50S ribosomal protein L32 [Candidatus Jorgensenbacteria bacterium]|nr:50S ribosomal protein L32 [Candidatus Jorgensenbacteria bacterium]